MLEGQVQQQTEKTILVVEDDPAIGDVLTQMIVQETPYQIVLMNTPTEALRRFREVQPDLVILNYHLPGMTGIDLYDRLHAFQELEVVPTIMVSATLPTYELIKRGIIGIGKPFDVSHLLQTIERLLASAS